MNKKVEDALAVLEEFGCIDKYESLIEIIKTNDLESLASYEYDIPDDRMNELKTLIQAGQLSTQQLVRIERVDRFILTNPVPPQLENLKKWLKRNALVVIDPNAIPDYPDTSPRPVPISSDPTRGYYTKKEIEFFKRRNEVYLNLWDDAKVTDLQVFDSQDHRSLAPARSALQRVFWGNHLTEEQTFRLIHADLRYLLDPEAEQMAPQYKKLIIELLEYYELDQFYAGQPEYVRVTGQPCDQDIKNHLNRWDWFTGTWEDEDTRVYETRRAISARWILDCYYQEKILSPQALNELIELDKAALLSANWSLLNRFERLFICKFLFLQGVFDPLPAQSASEPSELFKYLSLEPREKT